MQAKDIQTAAYDDQLVEALSVIRETIPNATTKIVVRLIKQGKLRATKPGRTWLARRSAIDNLIRDLMAEA